MDRSIKMQTFTAVIHKEEDMYVTECPEVGAASQGASIEAAINKPMKIFQVDAFTTKPFTGNPAGVCFLSETIPDSDMLKIAKELNLSDTAFLHKNDMGYNLRWFTPNPKQK